MTPIESALSSVSNQHGIGPSGIPNGWHLDGRYAIRSKSGAYNIAVVFCRDVPSLEIWEKNHRLGGYPTPEKALDRLRRRTRARRRLLAYRERVGADRGK